MIEIKARIEREEKVYGAVRWSGTDFRLLSDRLVIDMGNRVCLSFALSGLRDKAVMDAKKSAGERVTFRVTKSGKDVGTYTPAKSKSGGAVKPQSSGVSIDDSFGQSLKNTLTKNWRGRPMSILGVAIILAEARGAKKTFTVGAIRLGLIRFNEKARAGGWPTIVPIDDGAILLYAPEDVERFKANYMENAAVVSKARSETARRVFSKKTGVEPQANQPDSSSAPTQSS